MDNRLKTKSFYSGKGRLDGAHAYEEFIEYNPYIEIVSLVVVDGDYLILTYRDSN